MQSEVSTVRFIKKPKAFPPVRMSRGAAGYDLRAPAGPSIDIAPHSRAAIPLGIYLELPSGYYGRIAPRSGLALRNGIDVGGGVIDSDYRGELSVILFNHSNETFSVEGASRIAQLVIEKCFTPDFVEVTNLSNTQRGEYGFGSTGV